MYNFIPNMAPRLETNSVPLPVAAMAVPQPMSYQFQVVEFMKDDKIVKVELQVQCTTHMADGTVLHASGFSPVPRIQLPFVDNSK